MLTLNSCERLLKKRKVIGRGGARGGTSGRGHKGQKARTSGTVGPVFEGGQMPLTRRLPKRGFNNTRFAQSWKIINIDLLEEKSNVGDVITREYLVERGIIKKSDTSPIKVLGSGKLSKKLIVHADAFSQGATKSITSQGGEIHVTKEK
jgi:large subunit ribosomal protein L15